jgi:hypothetical protein
LSGVSRGTSLRFSNMPVGTMPGARFLRGPRAAVLDGTCAGNWLWRRVRIAMLVVGWAAAEASGGGGGGPMGGGGPAFLEPDWVKRCMNELLRAGRDSVGVAVKACIVVVLAAGLAPVLAGCAVEKLAGTGKSLSVGS